MRPAASTVLPGARATPIHLPAWLTPDDRALLHSPATGDWTTDDLQRSVGAIVAFLAAHAPAERRVGVLLDNTAQWIAIDLATQLTGATNVPLPGFFSAVQLEHAVRSADIRILYCQDERLAARLGFDAHPACTPGAGVYRCTRFDPPVPGARLARAVQKITFTSGTTGAPKGVCLTLAEQLATAHAVATVARKLHVTRHLCLLPFAVLLENIAGVYAALLAGATVICPPLAETGLAGASGFDAQRCLDAIGRYRPDSIILLPQMLAALTHTLEAHRTADTRIRTLRFVAVGGAPMPRGLIERARRIGLPAYEGYGLSECASVATLNFPGQDRPGTVGRPLPGTRVRIAADGEIEIAGRGFAGYLDDPRAHREAWFATGDLGTCDAAGYITITGRKKNVLVSSFGRNVSPEWPETALTASPAIAQAAVFGDARPYLVAVLVASSARITDDDLREAVEHTNRGLPDYARLHAWIRAPEPFSNANRLATPNGRIRRDAVWGRYARDIDRLYQPVLEHP